MIWSDIGVKPTQPSPIERQARDILEDCESLLEANGYSESVMSGFKMALGDMKNIVETVMNSIFAETRKAEREQREEIEEMKQRAEELLEEAQEEIKSQAERELLQGHLTDLKEEAERMRKTRKRLRDYNWKEEMENIHQTLLNRLTSLLTETDEKEEDGAK